MRLLKIAAPVLFLSFIGISLCFTLSSCEDSSVTTTTPPDLQEFAIRPSDYTDSYYFIDTIYKKAFREIYTKGNITYTDSNAIYGANMQIWVQTEVTNENKRNAVLDIDLPAVYGKEKYDTTSYVNEPFNPGRRIGIYVRKLDVSEYSVNLDAGFICLQTNLPDMYGVGITYQYSNNPEKRVGLGENIAGETNTLLLKMVKLPSAAPSDTLAWAQKMKNVYRLPLSHLLPDYFSLKVNYVDPTTLTESPTLPTGTSLLLALKLDRYTGNNFSVIAPDNLFDYREGYTIRTLSGDIIFPSLEPFSSDIRSYPGNEEYSFDELYNRSKSEAYYHQKNNYYLIRGTCRNGGW